MQAQIQAHHDEAAATENKPSGAASMVSPVCSKCCIHNLCTMDVNAADWPPGPSHGAEMRRAGGQCPHQIRLVKPLQIEDDGGINFLASS